MITGTAKLIVDLGNSETRVQTIFGKTAKGNVRKRTHTLSNGFSPIPDSKLNGALHMEGYDDSNSTVFMLNGQAYCNGRMADIEYKQTVLRPSALEKKFESMNSKLALINAFHQAYEDVCAMSNCGRDQLDISWVVTVLLPPENIDIGAKPMAEMVKGINHLEFLMPEYGIDVNIDKINILPEGFCAFIGVIFSDKGVIRPEYKYLVENNEDTLICDIGAGTTDFVLVHGSQVVSTSRYTKEIGGNNVHRIVQRELKKKGISLPSQAVQTGCQTGVVTAGAMALDVTADIAEAKKIVSRQLVDAVQEFFESSMIPVNTISNLLVVGGGAEESVNEKINPISNYLVEYMSRISPYIKLVEIPKEENTEGEVQRMSVRMLNIIGAGIIAG